MKHDNGDSVMKMMIMKCDSNEMIISTNGVIMYA